jgi:hypothetical protein
MAKLTLNDLANLQNETTAVSTINSNSDLIEAALENTLSLDGTTPNSMLADFDMNGNQILNLPAPEDPTSPLRLQDLTTYVSEGVTDGDKGDVVVSGNGTVWTVQDVGVTDGDKGDVVVSGGGAVWTIDSNAITTAKIADSQVTTAKIADSNVTTAKILDANVTAGTLATSSVTADKIADGVITYTKMATDTIRKRLTTATTFYVRSVIGDVTLSIASPSVASKTAHGLQVNDPVVFSILPFKSLCTMTIASPCVVTLNTHGYTAGQPIKFSTSGALATGITAGSTYYVIATGLTTNTFQFSATPGGSAVNSSVSQSGVHYVEKTGTMPTGVTAGDVYYVKSVPTADTFTFSTTEGGGEVGTSGATEGIISCATGNDNNDGLTNSRSGAFLTLQNGYYEVETNYDFNNTVHTLQMADSKYNVTGTGLSVFGPPAPGPQTSGNGLNIYGNTTYPGNTWLNCTGSGFLSTYHGQIQLRGLRIDAASGRCCYASAQGRINVQGNMEWGTASLDHMNANMGGSIVISGTGYIISGNTLVGHLHATGGGLIESTATNITILGQPTNSFGFIRCITDGYIIWNNAVFTGTTLGPKHVIETGGSVVTTGSPDTYFPGVATSSTCITGGRYLDFYVWTNKSKRADQTRTATTTFASDDTMTFSAVASATYRVKIGIHYTTPAAADIKFQITGPASPTYINLCKKSVAGGATAFGTIAIDTAFSTSTSVTGTGTDGYFEYEGVIQNGVNAGTIAVQWAQDTSDAGNTIVRAGSFIDYMRIA